MKKITTLLVGVLLFSSTIFSQCIYDSCNLVGNPKFQINTGCTGAIPTPWWTNALTSVNCWQARRNSPDVIKDCGFINTSHPNLMSWDNDLLNNYGAIWNDEAMQNEFSSQLIPGQPYTLTFRANGNFNNSTPGSWDIYYSPATVPMLNATPNIQAGATFLQSVSLTPQTWQYYTIQIPSAPANFGNIIIHNTVATYTGIDDVVIVPNSIAGTLSLPQLCVSQTIPDLSTFLTNANTTGYFTGPNDQPIPAISNNLGVYSLDASLLGIGIHEINYHYTSPQGCDMVIADYINIVSNGIVPTFNPIPTLCAGTSSNPLQNNSTNNPSISGTWSPAFDNTQTLQYTFTPSPNQCATTAQVTVSIGANQAPNISFVEQIPTSICAGTSVTFTPQNGNNYILSAPGTTTMTSTGQPFTFIPIANTTYTLWGTDGTCNNTITYNFNVIPCNSCGGCPIVLAASGVLASDPAPDVYCVINDVSISGNVMIRGSELKIMPGITITVLNGSKLTILGSWLHACADMWNGIIVEPGGAILIEAMTGPTEPPQINETCLIEDAITAVDMTGNILTSDALVCHYATFNRNYVGIKIENYTLTTPVYPFEIIGSVFTCRKLGAVTGSLVWPLTTTVKQPSPNPGPNDNPYIDNAVYPGTSLKAPMVGTFPLQGIWLTDVGLTTLNYPQPPSYLEFRIGKVEDGSESIFDSHQYGIYAESSNLMVMHTVFQNSKFTGVGSGIGIHALSQGTNNNRLIVDDIHGIKGTGNVFFNCHRGINSEYYLENYINNNTFASTHAWPYNISQFGDFGIKISTNRYRNIEINQNKLTNITKAIHFNVVNGQFDVGNGVMSGIYEGNINVNYNAINKFWVNNQSTDFVWYAINLNNNLTFPVLDQILGGSNITLHSNHLLNVTNGIYTQYFKGRLKIYDNWIRLWADLSGSNNPQYGIESKGNYWQSTEQNKITGFNLEAPDVYAIRSIQCRDQIIRCNDLRNTYFGMIFIGDCDISEIKYNKFLGHHRGLSLTVGSEIGEQGDINTPSDNIWYGFWPANPTGVNDYYKTSVEGAGAGIGNSKLWVRPGSFYDPDLSSFSFSGVDFSSANGTLDFVQNPPDLLDCDRIELAEKGNSISKPINMQPFDVVIYPNPSDGRVFIATTLRSTTKAKVVITDVRGKVVFFDGLAFFQNKTEILFDALPGIYFVKIIDEISNESVVKTISIK